MPNNMFPCCVCHHDITHLPGRRAIKQRILSPSLLHTQKEGFFLFLFFSFPRAGASFLTATLKGSGGCDSCISLRRRRCTSSLMGSRRQSGTAQQQQRTNRQARSPQFQPCSGRAARWSRGSRYLAVYLPRFIRRRCPLRETEGRDARTRCSRRGSTAEDRWAIPPEDIEPLTAATSPADEERGRGRRKAGGGGGRVVGTWEEQQEEARRGVPPVFSLRRIPRRPL